MYKKKNFRGSQRRAKYEDKTSHGYDGKPEFEGAVKVGLSAKALRDLPHSSYSVIADPYTAALPGSAPYPLINIFNKSYGGNYKGDANLDGGNVQQYANSYKSKFLSAFDCMRLKLGINYQYLPIKPRTSANERVGRQLINEMRKAISEAISVLQTTTYTQMAINNFVVETDLPLGDGLKYSKQTGQHPAVEVYTNKTDVFYAMSIYYQLFLQDILNTLRFHNAFRLKQGTMIRNAWDREVGLLNSFFGLMNKKSFINLVDSANLFFEGEYVDTDFCAQAGMVNYAPSRRSNSMLDPVLEIQTHFNHPTKFIIYQTDADGNLIWDGDSSSYLKIWDDAMLNITIGGETKHLFDVLDDLNDYLSLEATTYFARTTTYTGVAATDNARFNTIKKLFDYVIVAMNVFKPKWADYRQALDTLSRAGITRWVKGFRPSIEQSTDAPLFNNLLVNDIYKFVLGGATDINFDDATKRWRTFSLWNMYYGIPEYDKVSGGAFLTYSFKNIVAPVDSDANLEYLPLIFEKEEVGAVGGSVSCVAVSRGGPHTIAGVQYSDRAVEAKITAEEVTIASNPVFERLAPLTSQSTLKMRVPYVSFANNPELSSADRSMLYKLLTGTVGYCKIGLTQTTVDYAVDPDILSIYQVEIEDTTNMSITFARNCGPIRGTTSPAGVLGFSGLSAKAGE